MTVVVTGANGRMGTAIRELAAEREIETIACSRTPSEAVEPDSLRSTLAERQPAAVIDMTVPERTRSVIDDCVETTTPLVVGTTGFEPADEALFERASETIALLKATNFAPGVQALESLLTEAVQLLDDYDVELTETHHNDKRDAPSGTANSLLAAIEAAGEFGDRVYGREGEQPRSADEIGVHVRRAGAIHGEHEITLAANDEVITLAHRAESRRVFAAGALDSAQWIAERPPGRYDFAEVVAAQ